MENAMLVLGLFDWANHAIHKLFLWIDSGVYWFASECYQLFIKLASTKIFEDEFFSNFANRIYAILGIFMLFYLAYALLTALVDPEKIKGDKGVSKIATNLVISLVMLGFLPSVFTYAYRLQNYVLSSNLIGSLVLGTPTLGTDTTDENHEAMLKYGDVLSFSVLNVFLNSENINVNLGQLSNGRDYNWFDLKADILEKSDYSKMIGLDVAVSTGANEINKDGSDGELKIIDYKPLLSTAAGILLIYVLFSFTLDLGKRVVLLAFYQLIAPIPVILRAIPGKKAIFDKSLKQTVSVYLQVFMESGAMYIAIYFIDAMGKSHTLKQFFSGGIQGLLAFAIIMMGILVVAKELPKKIADLFGLDAGNFKLGIKDKLKAGGFFAGGAMLGAGALGLVRGGLNATANFLDRGMQGASAFSKGNIWEGLSHFGSAVGETVTGVGATFLQGLSGVRNAHGAGKDAKGFKDMGKALMEGADKAMTNRENRAAYIARHDGVFGAMGARLSDGADFINRLAGVAPSMDALKAELSSVTGVTDAHKAVIDRLKFIRDTLEKGERHVTFDWTSVDGTPMTTTDKEIGLLRQEYESLKASGADATTLRNKEIELKAGEAQANEDIFNGWAKTVNAQGQRYRVAPEDYDGDLKAQAIKLMTNIQNATKNLSDNVKFNNSDLVKAVNFASENMSKDISQLTTNNQDVYNALMKAIRKPMYEAKDNINQKINAVYEQQKKDKK